MANLSHHYNGRSTIVQAFLCLLFTLFAGCAGVTIKDDLPPSSAKGYVDFSNNIGGFCVNHCMVNIYSVKNGKQVEEGSITGYGDALRIARTPGTYDFYIRHVTVDPSSIYTPKQITVKIMQDMLTFVTIDSEILGERVGTKMGEWGKTFTTYYVKISIADNPAPTNLQLQPNKTDILNNLLDDQDRRARLYAIDALEKMGNSIDEKLVKKVKVLSVDDSDRSVRDKSRKILSNLKIDVFGDLLLLENFENKDRKWTYLNGSSAPFYPGNDAILVSSPEDRCYTLAMKAPIDLPSDFDIELLSIWKSGIDNNAYGLFMGSNANNFDHFGISGYGQAVVRPIRNNKFETDLIAWTDFPAIKDHGKSPNRQRVEVRGDIWKYYVNNAYVGTITNTMKMNKYIIGVRVCSGQTIAFDQLKITRVNSK